MWISVITWIFLSVLNKVELYPLGAPLSVCVNQVPHHKGASQRDGPSPYVISTSNTSYSPGDNITVTITSPSGLMFRGFQMRALQVGGNAEELFGNFINLPANVRGMMFNIADNEWDCISHTDNAEKREIVVTFNTPALSVGEFIFQATVLEDFETYWRITSEVMTPIVDKELDFPPLQINLDLPPVLVSAGCGKEKGCVLYPRDCEGSDCLTGLSYKTDEDSQTILFEFFGKAQGYISVGFSADRKMGDDKSVTCVADEEGARGIHYGYNPAYYNARYRLNKDRLTELAVARHEGVIYCQFRRSFYDDILHFDIETLQVRHIQFAFNESAHVFIAIGELYYKTDEPVSHAALPFITQDKVNFSEFGVYHPYQINGYYKAHGSLGLTAWLLLSPIVAFIARHFKDELGKNVGGEGICGSKVWLHLHRGLAILTFVCGAIGVIVIFSYLKAWTMHSTVHAVFGLVATGLALLNIVAGLVRPSPDSKIRPVFNWGHRINFILIFVCAVVAIFLGITDDLLFEDYWKTVILITALWLAAIILWGGIFEAFIFCRSRKADYDVGQKSSNDCKFTDKSLLMGLFVAASIGFFIAAIYFIATA